jgi:hypothetical protein
MAVTAKEQWKDRKCYCFHILPTYLYDFSNKESLKVKEKNLRFFLVVAIAFTIICVL